MSIKEALVRQSEADLIEIGELTERTLNGQFGDVLRAFVNGMITQCLTVHQDNPSDRMPVSSDRLLGRAEAYQNCILGLEKMVEDMKDLKTPIEQEEEDDE